MNILGSFSRSAVNYNAGAKTAFSNIVMAGSVLVTMLFFMSLFYYTPNLILAAIIITAVIGLIDYNAAFLLWKLDKLDFLACLCSFFGVLFISVPIGLAISVIHFSPHFSLSFSFFIMNYHQDTKYYHNFRLEFQYSRYSSMLPGLILWYWGTSLVLKYTKI